MTTGVTGLRRRIRTMVGGEVVGTEVSKQFRKNRSCRADKTLANF